ncbi:diguanylate cyclase [Alteromonas sediminis]|uniref:diguanylate cyclase n=1 Tax=Alteromonas sediminis TaxID=2259342 RepID=A0A3N5XYY2_9ALTE|nr:GGDEF domain-containing protein [Alteromonas sediminis]RPJ66447.1 diguanylate cyclase [Alteromonas sediminis]
MLRWMFLLVAATVHISGFAATFVIHQFAFEQRSFDDIQEELNARIDQTAPSAQSIDAQVALASLYVQYERPELLFAVVTAIEQYESYQDKPLYQALNYFFRGVGYHLQHDYEAAEVSYSAGLAIIESSEINYPNGSLYLTTIFEIYQAANATFLQEYSDSVAALTALKNIADQNEWRFLSALSLYWLGDVNYELKHYEQAETYFKQAKTQFPNDASLYIARSTMREAQMTNIVGERAEAFSLLNQAMVQLEQSGDVVSLAYAYLLQSYFHDKNLDHDLALAWIAKSVALRESLGVDADIANAYVHYSAILGRNGDNEQARSYAKKAADLVEGTQDLTGQWDAFHNYANQLYTSGDYKRAYEYMLRSERALLAKARLDITEETARLLNQFSFQQQSLENQFLDEKARLLQTQLAQEQQMKSRQTVTIVALSVFAVVVLMLLILIYRLYLNNKKLAVQDPLTLLSNRREILARGEHAFAMCQRYKQAMCVLMIDIDKFKAINDNHGHDVGDKALILAANALKSVLRNTDSIGRVGGEEFLVILPHCTQDKAEALVNRIFTALGDAVASSDLPISNMTISVGLSMLTSTSTNFIELAKLADQALFKAKEQGRNQMQIYGQVDD